MKNNVQRWSRLGFNTALLLVVFLVSACGRGEMNAYEKAKAAGTLAAYRSFIDGYPQSDKAIEIAHEIVSIKGDQLAEAYANGDLETIASLGRVGHNQNLREGAAEKLRGIAHKASVLESVLKADQLLGTGDFLQARELYAEVVARDAENQFARFGLGLTFIGEGRRDEAKELFASLNLDVVPAHVRHIGRLYLLNGANDARGIDSLSLLLAAAYQNPLIYSALQHIGADARVRFESLIIDTSDFTQWFEPKSNNKDTARVWEHVGKFDCNVFPNTPYGAPAPNSLFAAVGALSAAQLLAALFDNMSTYADTLEYSQWSSSAGKTPLEDVLEMLSQKTIIEMTEEEVNQIWNNLRVVFETIEVDLAQGGERIGSGVLADLKSRLLQVTRIASMFDIPQTRLRNLCEVHNGFDRTLSARNLVAFLNGEHFDDLVGTLL